MPFHGWYISRAKSQRRLFASISLQQKSTNFTVEICSLSFALRSKFKNFDFRLSLLHYTTTELTRIISDRRMQINLLHYTTVYCPLMIYESIVSNWKIKVKLSAKNTHLNQSGTRKRKSSEMSRRACSSASERRLLRGGSHFANGVRSTKRQRLHRIGV